MLLILASLAAAAFAWWRQRSPAVLFCLLIIPGYLTFLCLSISFLDAQTPLDTRILAPLFPLWLLMIVASASAISPALTRDRVQMGGVAALLLIIVVGAPIFLRQTEAAILHGVALADRRAVQQEVIRYAAQLEKERAIYTNFNEWLYLHYNRDAQMLPHLYNPNTMELNPNIEDAVDAMVADLRDTDGIVVWVDFILGRPYLIDLELLTEQVGLEVVAEMQGGKVLKLRAPAPDTAENPDPG